MTAHDTLPNRSGHSPSDSELERHVRAARGALFHGHPPWLGGWRHARCRRRRVRSL